MNLRMVMCLCDPSWTIYTPDVHTYIWYYLIMYTYSIYIYRYCYMILDSRLCIYIYMPRVYIYILFYDVLCKILIVILQWNRSKMSPLRVFDDNKFILRPAGYLVKCTKYTAVWEWLPCRVKNSRQAANVSKVVSMAMILYDFVSMPS